MKTLTKIIGGVALAVAIKGCSKPREYDPNPTGPIGNLQNVMGAVGGGIVSDEKKVMDELYKKQGFDVNSETYKKWEKEFDKKMMEGVKKHYTKDGSEVLYFEEDGFTIIKPKEK